MSFPHNPLAHGLLGEDPTDLGMYWYDPDAPNPFGNSDNNIVAC